MQSVSSCSNNFLQTTREDNPTPWISSLPDYEMDGIKNGMSITITLGKSGRLVVPKSIRDHLGLHEGSRLKLEIQGGKLQAAPEPDPVDIEMKDGFPVIHSVPRLKRGSVVQAIKADRDSRDERATPPSRRK
ncbi:MAG: AbrB/MazE/SpoVT family DNA-binding domain-containing protein [Luteolibacter sp.]